MSDEYVYEEVQTSVFFRINKRLLAYKKLARMKTQFSYADKLVNLTHLAKSAKRNETTDVIIKMDYMLPSEKIVSALKTFWMEFDQESTDDKDLKILAIKKVVKIAFATNQNERSRDDDICLQFSPFIGECTVEETKPYLKDTNLQVIQLLRKERVKEIVSAKVFTMKDPSLYMKKICPCVDEDDDDDWCQFGYKFESSAMNCINF